MKKKRKKKKSGCSTIIANPLLTHLTNKRWLYGCLLFFCLSCNQGPQQQENQLQQQLQQLTRQRIAHAHQALEQVRPLLKQGDIVTRTGTDFTSESLRQLCRRDPTYSHCGIIYIEQGRILVYHVLGGEINPDQRLKKETLETFCDGNDNRGFGIFRIPLSPKTAQRLDSLLQTYYAAGLPFDMDFDLHTDARMYCSEFVYKVFSRATRQPHLFNTSFIRQREYVGVDDIFLQKTCIEIGRFRY